VNECMPLLSGIPELKIGVAYKHSDGEVNTRFPADIDELADVEAGAYTRSCQSSI